MVPSVILRYRMNELISVGLLENAFTLIMEPEKSTHTSNVEMYAVGGGDFLEWKQMNQENGMRRCPVTRI